MAEKRRLMQERAVPHTICVDSGFETASSLCSSLEFLVPVLRLLPDHVQLRLADTEFAREDQNDFLLCRLQRPVTIGGEQY